MARVRFSAFKEYINYFIETRLQNMQADFERKSPKYRYLENKIIRIQKKTIAALPEKSKGLVLEYEETELLRDTMLNECIYKKGFMDGVRVSNLVRVLLKLR